MCTTGHGREPNIGFSGGCELQVDIPLDYPGPVSPSLKTSSDSSFACVCFSKVSAVTVVHQPCPFSPGTLTFSHQSPCHIALHSSLPVTPQPESQAERITSQFPDCPFTCTGQGKFPSFRENLSKPDSVLPISHH